MACFANSVTSHFPFEPENYIYNIMYEHQGLQDIIFIMLYGGATMFAIAACCYLLLVRGAAFFPDITPPRSLRRWAAAFMASVALSHVWWVVLGIYCLTEDRLVRNIMGIMLDRITFVPLIMAVLIRMLQDRKRSLVPVALSTVPLILLSVYGIIAHDENTEIYIEIYSVFIISTFIIYMVCAVIQYGKWLRDNYADLEHKEVWQSFSIMALLCIVFVIYCTNAGHIAVEYLVQLMTYIIIVFVVWRVESLQKLQISSEKDDADYTNGNQKSLNIKQLLVQHCENTKLYLRHDLSLDYLCHAIGTNHYYLSQHFAQQGITYNTYINTLRIEHFMSIYPTMRAEYKTAQQIADVSGFKSYSTFSAAFKRIKGQTFKEWISTLS